MAVRGAWLSKIVSGDKMRRLPLRNDSLLSVLSGTGKTNRVEWRSHSKQKHAKIIRPSHCCDYIELFRAIV